MTDQLYKVSINRYPVDAKIPGGDPSWGRFNAGFDNTHVTPEQFADKIYNGHSFTTWHKDHRRITANYLLGQHIALDFDSGDNNSDMWNLINNTLIKKYAGFLYTTMSHTEEAPRCRVVFLLDQPIMQAKNYGMAATALLWLFSGADRNCKDAVRFFYGSKHCEFQILGNVMPIEKIKHIITQYQESARLQRKKYDREFKTDNPTMAEVADALQKIDPDTISYHEWLSVLMGIHSEFGDAGLSMADNWAHGYSGEVEKKFASFKKEGNGSEFGPATINSVYKLAYKFGWSKGS